MVVVELLLHQLQYNIQTTSHSLIGLAIVILGIQSVHGAVKNIKAAERGEKMVNLKDYAPFTGLLILEA